MQPNPLEQARELFRTASLLKKCITQRFAEGHKSQGEGMPCAEMTLPQSLAVMEIHERGSLTIKELAETLHVSPPSASAMVDRLVEMGMLVREQNQEDRREVKIQISESGESNLREVENQVFAFLLELIESLGPEMTQQWCSVYRKIREIIEEKFQGAAAIANKEQAI